MPFLASHFRCVVAISLALSACAGESPDDDVPCDSSEVGPDSYADCTCAGVPDSPPSTLGCSEPRQIITRVCLVDASCRAYPYDPEVEPLTRTTSRDDVAVRWEWTNPIPATADLSLNRAPAADSPVSLFAKADPTFADLPLFAHPETAIDADVVVSDDRRAITLVPVARCLAGDWLIDSGLNLTALHGEPVCGEPEGAAVGEGAQFVLF